MKYESMKYESMKYESMKYESMSIKLLVHTYMYYAFFIVHTHENLL